MRGGSVFATREFFSCAADYTNHFVSNWFARLSILDFIFVLRSKIRMRFHFNNFCWLVFKLYYCEKNALPWTANQRHYEIVHDSLVSRFHSAAQFFFSLFILSLLYFRPHQTNNFSEAFMEPIRLNYETRREWRMFIELSYIYWFAIVSPSKCVSIWFSFIRHPNWPVYRGKLYRISITELAHVNDIQYFETAEALEYQLFRHIIGLVNGCYLLYSLFTEIVVWKTFPRLVFIRSYTNRCSVQSKWAEIYCAKDMFASKITQMCTTFL